MKASLCLLIAACLSLPAWAATAPAAAQMMMPPLPPAPSGIQAATIANAEATVEQRRQQELVANAEKLDQANRELLAQNQELKVQNENLNMLAKELQDDRSADGIRNGALAVIGGLIIGWFFAGIGNRSRSKSSW